MTNFIRSFFAARQRSYLLPIGIICFIGLSYLACRKSAGSSSKLSDQALIQSYRNYFEANVQPFHNPDTSVSSAEIRMTLHKTPNWARAVVKQFNFGRAVVVPIAFKEKIYLQSSLGEISLDSTSAMILYADDKGAMHSEVVTKMPDRNFLFGMSKTFTGIAAVEDWSGRPLVAYNYTSTGASPVESKITSGSTIPSGAASGKQVEDETDAFCTVYDYYLCPDGTVTDDCVFEYSYGDAGCSAGGGSGGTGGENNQNTALKVIYDYNTTPTGDLLTPAQRRTAAEQFTFPVSASPITDIPGYIHCFDGTGSTYSVALLVNQPEPGSNAEYLINAPGSVPLYNVGHTFLAFYETLTNGTQIVRYMGTYPQTIDAGFPVGQKPVVLGDDHGQPYNAGLTIPVTASQFSSILSYMTNITGMYYNVYTNNCTTMALNALAAGGYTLTPMELPFPSIDVSDFTNAENSGALGYYILNTTFSSNMTVTNASMTAGANAGTCN